jgi:protein O-mannosyl-transferase
MRFRFPALAMLCALVFTCMFLPGLGGGFIFDDRPNIEENFALHLTELSVDGLMTASYSFQPGHGSRALPMLSFALDHWRGGGLDPRTFKATNLVIHALTAFALALLLRRLLTLAKWPARRAAVVSLAVAGLWTIHPLQVSSVLYVVQRMQTLGTLFIVLALWAYLVARQAQIDGQRSRTHLVLAGLFGALAFAAKEDALLLPLYTLVLELTVLRFRAAQPALARWLRRGYLAMAMAGLALYLLVLLPHYWSWGDYPGRTFSSVERLLTQGRVLVMYLGQILLPLPDRLPFFYDTLPVSRGLLDPPSTLPAWGLVGALLALAWRWRERHPTFACGVLLFFAGHAMTSNVLNLEMAFEHRNHLPLIGALLALVSLSIMAGERLQLRPPVVAGATMIVFIALGSATLVKAYAWGEPLRFAQYSVEIAPDSERAWLALGGAYADLGGFKASSPYLQKAIEACQLGAQRVDSALLLSNIVIYKTIKGDVTQEDWHRFNTRLAHVPMTLQNRNAVWTMIRNARHGVPMDERGVLDTIEIVSRRAGFSYEENLQLASYAFNDTAYAEAALPYLKRAVEHAPPNDPLIKQTLLQLEAAGREDWVQQLDAIRREEH